MTTPTGPGAAEWVRVPGQTTRRYRNTRTGEVISRRQFDERYGRLRAQGFRSNEAQAAAHKSAGAPLGPARGRLKHTSVRDTDFFTAPKNLLAIRAKLQQLLRYGYVGVRFVFGPPGGVHVNTGWYRLTAGDIPHILQQLQLNWSNVYPGGILARDEVPVTYSLRDLSLIAAVKTLARPGVA